MSWGVAGRSMRVVIFPVSDHENRVLGCMTFESRGQEEDTSLQPGVDVV